MRLAILSLVSAVFGLASANATTLQFSAVTDAGATVTFTLNTAVPDTYSPALYPNILPSGVFLNAVHDLNFEGIDIAVSDVVTMPGVTGDGRPLTVMNVGPLFDNESLSLSLIFLDGTLVTPLSSNPSAYEQSFAPFESVLFPAEPPPRQFLDSLNSLTVSEASEPSPVPEPSYAVVIAVIGLFSIALRRFGVRANQGISHF